MKFSDPVGAEEIEWRLQTTKQSNDGSGIIGLAVPYVTANAVARRLDAVCEENAWRWGCSFREVIAGKPDETHIECTITVYDAEGNATSRADVGEGHDADGSTGDPVKAAYTDAFKRAGARWGIGREVRDISTEWIRGVTQQGRTWVITAEGYDELAQKGGRQKRRGARSGGAKNAPQRPPQAAPAAQRAPAAQPPAEPSRAAPAPAQAPAANGNGSGGGVDWTRFWGRVGRGGLGFERKQVYETAGVASFADWTQPQVDALYERLAAIAAGKVEGR